MSFNRRLVICVYLIAAIIIMRFPAWGAQQSLSDWAVLASYSEPTAKVEKTWMEELAEEFNVSDPVSLGLSGRGVPVAIVDTGIDVASLKSGCVLDWVNVTGEGSVVMSEPLPMSKAGTVVYDGRSIGVAGVRSVSGNVRVGLWGCAYLRQNPEIGPIIGDRQGMLIVVADNYLIGQYDTVYIDCNGDGQLGDERPLEVFQNCGYGVSLYSRDRLKHLTVVATDIKENGGRVELGFDGHGHGTSVASVIVGDDRGFAGVAPGAQLISVKAVESSGRASWTSISDGIVAACERGAKLVVLSVVPVDRVAPGRLAETFGTIRKTYGALVIMAAGNNGPGLGSLSDCADYDAIVTVGGYIPRSVERRLGWDTGGQVWPWTSIGPTTQGRTVSMLGPALGPVLHPFASTGEESARVLEGTSYAATYVSGVAALLAEAQTRTGGRFNAATLKKALVEGGVSLSASPPIMQGYGVVSARRSLELLQSGSRRANIRMVSVWRGEYQTGGFFDRDRIPGYVPLGLDNLSPFQVGLGINTPEWLSVADSRMTIPAVEQQTTCFGLVSGLPEGFYSGFIRAKEVGTSFEDARFLVTAVVPHALSRSGFSGVQRLLGTGEVHREFLRVDATIGSLHVALDLRDRSGMWPLGRFKLYVYDRDGSLVYESPWVGAGTDLASVTANIDVPAPGVWEFVILSDPSSLSKGAGSALARLSVAPTGIVSKNVSDLRLSRNTEKPVLRLSLEADNTEQSFRCVPLALVPGVNGFAEVKSLTIPDGVSLAQPLPNIERGTQFLYLSAASVVDRGNPPVMYLFRFDAARGGWTEVVPTSSFGDSRSIRQGYSTPVPGRYIAYIENGNQGMGGLTAMWSAVAVESFYSRPTGQYLLTEQSFQWDEGVEKSVRLDIDRGMLQQEPILFVTLWDESLALLKGIVPVEVVGQGASPLVQVLHGTYRFLGRTAITVKAFDPETFRPIDASIQIGDAWYQLHRGTATVIVSEATLNDVRVRAEYPGLCPKVKTLHE